MLVFSLKSIRLEPDMEIEGTDRAQNTDCHAMQTDSAEGAWLPIAWEINPGR